MKIYIYKIALLSLLSYLVVGCNPHFDSPLDGPTPDSRAAYSGHQLAVDQGNPDSILTQILDDETGFYWEDSVSVAYGKVDGMDFMVRKAISAPDKAILEIRAPEPDPRVSRCSSPDSSFVVRIKLTNPLSPGYTVAAFLPPNSLFDSVKVHVPAPDSIVLVIYAPQSNVIGSGSSSEFQVKIYISDGAGNSLPEVDNLIESMATTCGGIEVVIMPELCMDPNIEFRESTDLFRTFNQNWNGRPLGEIKIWNIIEAIWHNEGRPHSFSARHLVRMDMVIDGQ